MSIGFMLLLGFVFAVVYQKMRGIGLLEVLVIVATSILCPIIASAASFGLNTWLGNNTCREFFLPRIILFIPFLQTQ